MKEYRQVVQFYYKGILYNMYLDNNNKHFFLKNENNNLSYLDINELVDLVIHFHNIPNVMRVEKNSRNKKKKKIIPKVIIGGIAVSLTLSKFLIVFSLLQNKINDDKYRKDYNITSEYDQNELSNYLSFDDEDLNVTEENTEENNLEVDTYLESEWLNYLYIYDMNYLDKALEYDNVTIDQVKEEIKNNNSISEKFKKYLYEYCDCLNEKYPNIELRVFYENLKTLEIVECDKSEMVFKTLSMDSYGCYVRTENKIYVLKDFEYEKGSWAYQVLFHEFSHCLRTGTWEKNGTEIKVQIEGQNFDNVTTSEALNSLFAVSLFDYEEKDIAYQLQSNYHKILTENMDNYTLDDYVTHSESYYAKKLDEYNGDENYATVILELIQMQYDDYHDDSISIDQTEFYPIYDYIAKMYYKNNINSEMSYSDAKNVTEELIEKITFDVPEEYNIDTEHFFDYLDEYCASIGIDCDVKVR